MKKRHYLIDGKIVEIVGTTYNPENPCEGCCLDNYSSSCYKGFKFGLSLLCAQFDLYPETREIDNIGLIPVFKEVPP